MDASNIDPSTLEQVTRLLNNSSEVEPLIDLSPLIAAIQPYVITLLVALIIVGIMTIIHIIQRMRVDHAILETRDIVREMNQRQKGVSPAQQKAAAELPAKSQSDTKS